MVHALQHVNPLAIHTKLFPQSIMTLSFCGNSEGAYWYLAYIKVIGIINMNTVHYRIVEWIAYHFLKIKIATTTTKTVITEMILSLIHI